MEKKAKSNVMDLNELKEIMMPSPELQLRKAKIENKLSEELKANNKLFAIIINKIKMLKKYRVIITRYYILAIPKKDLHEKINVVVAHFDNVYDTCFINEEGKYYLGTFDNSIGIYTLLLLAKQDKIDNTIFAFTDCEETNMKGIKSSYKSLDKRFKQKKIRYYVLDVTEEDVIESTTLENSNFQIEFLKDIKKIANKNCGYDESTFLLNNTSALTCSICSVLKMRNAEDFCHNKNGNYIKKENLEKYYNNICKILER